MATEIYRKKGDTARLKVTLVDDNGALDLTGSTVVFTMTSTSGTVKVNQQACVVLPQTVAANKGIVTYSFTSGQVDTAGKYYAEFKVTLPNGELLTVPSAPDPYVIIIIKDRLQ